MQLQVHLHQALWHVLDMRGGIFCQTFALAHVSPQGGDLRHGTETATQQAIGLQLAQPSGVADIGFASWHILGIAGIHEDDLEAMRLKDLEGRDPVNTGRLHCYAGDTTRSEPVGEIVKVLGERAEGAHRHSVAVGVHSRHVHGRANINRGRIGIDQLQVRVVSDLTLRHGISSIQGEGRGPCKFVIFLTGIAAMAASPLSSTHQPMCHVF